MPAKSFAVDVNPAVLRWARESAGYGVSDVADRCKESEAKVAAWESGQRCPTWLVLRKLALLYNRPIASLLLPTPPQEGPLPPDFRRLPGAKRELSPKTRLAIRMGRWLARKAAELQRQLGIDTEFQTAKVRPSENPEKIAQASREQFKIPVEEQIHWQTWSQALKEWRARIEAQHVFVFQFKMPVEEVRGFSLFEEARPVIVLNQSDAVSARIFTLVHEYAHLLIAQPGLCIPEEGLVDGSPQQIERFCNHFAAAVLIPSADLRQLLPKQPADESIDLLARRYRVSRYVVLGRMQELRTITGQEYQQITQRWQMRAEAVPAPSKKQKGGPTGVVRCLSERGRLFVSLVMEAAKREFITVNDANTYLGIRLKDFRRLEKKVK